MDDFGVDGRGGERDGSGLRAAVVIPGRLGGDAEGAGGGSEAGSPVEHLRDDRKIFRMSADGERKDRGVGDVRSGGDAGPLLHAGADAGWPCARAGRVRDSRRPLDVPGKRRRRRENDLLPDDESIYRQGPDSFRTSAVQRRRALDCGRFRGRAAIAFGPLTSAVRRAGRKRPTRRDPLALDSDDLVSLGSGDHFALDGMAVFPGDFLLGDGAAVRAGDFALIDAAAVLARDHGFGYAAAIVAGDLLLIDCAAVRAGDRLTGYRTAIGPGGVLTADAAAVRTSVLGAGDRSALGAG